MFMAKKKNKTLKKSSYLIWLSMVGFLSSCSHFSLRSKESMDAEEKKPWNKDERTVGGDFNKSKQRLTPHIGFKLPVDNGPDPVKIPINKKPEEIKTIIDKKRKIIKILKEKDIEDEKILERCPSKNQEE